MALISKERKTLGCTLICLSIFPPQICFLMCHSQNQTLKNEQKPTWLPAVTQQLYKHFICRNHFPADNFSNFWYWTFCRFAQKILRKKMGFNCKSVGSNSGHFLWEITIIVNCDGIIWRIFIYFEGYDPVESGHYNLIGIIQFKLDSSQLAQVVIIPFNGNWYT